MKILKSRTPFVYVAIVLVAGSYVGLAIIGSTNVPDRSASPSASRFSNYLCSASGAMASRVFMPSDTEPNVASADNTNAIQNTINDAASAGGGIVSLSAGTFYIDSHLVLKTNVKLTGAGTSTVLKAGSTSLSSSWPYGGYPLITTAGASNVTIANLIADQNGEAFNASVIGRGRLSAYLIDVRNSRNVVVDGVYTRNPFTYSIGVVRSSDFCIAHCNTQVATSGLYDGLDGIHVMDSHDGQVIDNYVDQRIGTDGDDGLVAHTLGAPVYDILYADNTVRGGNHGSGMQLAVGNHPIYDLTIRNNNFWGSPFGIRTGYWDTGADGAVHNIVISDNYIHNLVPGTSFPHGGNAVDIGGFGAIAPVTYISVTNNLICEAGIIIIAQGEGNAATDNHLCSP